MSNRYFLELCFDGSKFNGYQIQPNGESIQNEIQKVLKILLKNDIKVTGAGRTDAGVHAKYFVLHFDCNLEIEEYNNFIYKLNSILPLDISCFNIFKTKPDKHARFDAISRTYKYFFNTFKNPFINSYSSYLPHKPDIKLMNQAASIIKDYKDFTSFSKLHTDINNNICNVEECFFEEKGNIIVFTIKANRFLRNMVRATAGTLLDVGTKKAGIEDLRKIIESKNRNNAGASVPAKGLFLWDVKYEYFKRCPQSIRSPHITNIFS